MKFISFIIIAIFFVAIPAIPAVAKVCYISNLATLAGCIERQLDYTALKLTDDLSCNGISCCGSNGYYDELINLKAGTIFDGDGHQIKRSSNQRSCPLFTVFKANNVTIKNLVVDENKRVAPCELAEMPDNCANTFYLHGAMNVLIDNVSIYHGKGIVVNAWGVKNFVFNNSTISNAGVIGLHIGDKLWSQSKNITVTDSTFVGVRTNALAVTGVEGASIISNNIFSGNHYHGLWGNVGALENGGQLYIRSANNLVINNNVFFGGDCSNCRNDSVWAIEIGGVPGSGYNVSNVRIEGNLIFNTKTAALFHNDLLSINDTLVIKNNKIYGGYKLSNFNDSSALFEGNIMNKKWPRLFEQPRPVR